MSIIMEMQALIAGLVLALVVLVIIWDYRRERRQEVLDWFVFESSVSITKRHHRWGGDSAWVVLARLNFCPPKEARDEIKWDGKEKSVDVALTFNWGIAQRKYFLRHDVAKHLTSTVKRQGIGRRWDGPQWGSFASEVERAIATDLNSYDQSMASIVQD